MRKFRLESLPKKDREAIQSYSEVGGRLSADIKTLCQESYRLFRCNVDRPNRPGYPVYTAAAQFASFTFHLSSAISKRAILKRLLEDDIEVQRDGFVLASRLNYLSDLGKTPAYSGGCDCLHVLEILFSLAVRDYPAVHAFLRRHPYPAKHGHPWTVVLCNAVTAILSNSDDMNLLVDRLRQRNDGNYDRALLLCLAAIIEGDCEEVETCLDTMLAGHRRKTIANGMEKYFAVQVHGLYELACEVFRNRHHKPAPNVPTAPLWDEQFHLFVNSSASGIDFAVLQYFATPLVKWANTLPTDLAPAEFDSL